MVPMMCAWMNSPTRRRKERMMAWSWVAGSISSPSRMFTEWYTEKQYCWITSMPLSYMSF